MSHRIVYAKSFHKASKRLAQTEQKMVVRKILQLANNPFYPLLRSKKIKGTAALFECSVNMDIRIIWKYNEPEKDLLIMLDVGHHSIVDKMYRMSDSSLLAILQVCFHVRFKPPDPDFLIVI